MEARRWGGGARQRVGVWLDRCSLLLRDWLARYSSFRNKATRQATGSDVRRAVMTYGSHFGSSLSFVWSSDGRRSLIVSFGQIPEKCCSKGKEEKENIEVKLLITINGNLWAESFKR